MSLLVDPQHPQNPCKIKKLPQERITRIACIIRMYKMISWILILQWDALLVKEMCDVLWLTNMT